MKIKNLIILAIFPLWSFGIWDSKIHNVNNWYLTVKNYGQLGSWQDYWLVDSVEFGFAGLLFGSISPQAETLVTIGFGPDGGESEYVPGLKNQAHTSPIARIFIHPGDWPPDPDTFPMAPQIPLTCQESWSCYNDFDSAYHIPGDTKPIGIEVYQTTFADTLAMIRNVVYLKYEVKNCTTYTINEAIISIHWLQPTFDLPWMGFILHKWFHPTPNDSFLIEDLSYCYNDSSAIGFLFIITPNDLGCTANKNYSSANMPSRDDERYLVMAGYNFQSGTYDPYDSLGESGRAFISSGKFSLAPGETKEFVVALIGAEYINNDTLPLAITAKNARDFYLDSLYGWIEEDMASNKPIIPILKAEPNPFTDVVNIKFALSGYNPKIGRVANIKIIDATGRCVRSFDRLTNNKVRWSGDDDAGYKVPAGIYFCVLEYNGARACTKIVKLQVR
ncbi:MAG: hypothetical protein ACUVQ3_04025 [bacterium]